MEHIRHTEHFTLHPFQEEDFTTRCQISGTLARSTTGLRISYELTGSPDDVVLPSPVASPSRRDGLWQTTCFEFFIAVSGSPQYREVNLSPSGDWNVYVFTDYRHEMREETSVTVLPFTVRRQAEQYRLELDFPLAKLIAPEQSVDIAVSAVLSGRNNQQGFYALTHCGPRPDFHQRNSFLIRI
jgi:hypothetical protein